MRKTGYRGFVVFDDGRKLCTPFTKDICMARKGISEQLIFSKEHGRQYYKQREIVSDTDLLKAEPVKVYIEVWNFDNIIEEDISQYSQTGEPVS